MFGCQTKEGERSRDHERKEHIAHGRKQNKKEENNRIFDIQNKNENRAKKKIKNIMIIIGTYITRCCRKIK